MKIRRIKRNDLGFDPIYILICGGRKLRNNSLDGTLDIGTSNGKQLRSIDLQNNQISDYKEIPGLDLDVM